IRRYVPLALDLFQPFAQALKPLWLVESGLVVEPVSECAPAGFVDLEPGIFLDRLARTAAKVLLRKLRSCEPEDRALRLHQPLPALNQVVQRAKQFAACQVSGSAEYHDRARWSGTRTLDSQFFFHFLMLLRSFGEAMCGPSPCDDDILLALLLAVGIFHCPCPATKRRNAKTLDE